MVRDSQVSDEGRRLLLAFAMEHEAFHVLHPADTEGQILARQRPSIECLSVAEIAVFRDTLRRVERPVEGVRPVLAFFEACSVPDRREYLVARAIELVGMAPEFACRYRSADWGDELRWTDYISAITYRTREQFTWPASFGTFLSTTIWMWIRSAIELVLVGVWGTLKYPRERARMADSPDTALKFLESARSAIPPRPLLVVRGFVYTALFIVSFAVIFPDLVLLAFHRRVSPAATASLVRVYPRGFREPLTKTAVDELDLALAVALRDRSNPDDRELLLRRLRAKLQAEPDKGAHPELAEFMVRVFRDGSDGERREAIRCLRYLKDSAFDRDLHQRIKDRQFSASLAPDLLRVTNEMWQSRDSENRERAVAFAGMLALFEPNAFGEASEIIAQAVSDPGLAKDATCSAFVLLEADPRSPTLLRALATSQNPETRSHLNNWVRGRIPPERDVLLGRLLQSAWDLTDDRPTRDFGYDSVALLGSEFDNSGFVTVVNQLAEALESPDSARASKSLSRILEERSALHPEERAAAIHALSAAYAPVLPDCVTRLINTASAEEMLRLGQLIETNIASRTELIPTALQFLERTRPRDRNGVDEALEVTRAAVWRGTLAAITKANQGRIPGAVKALEQTASAGTFPTLVAVIRTGSPEERHIAIDTAKTIADNWSVANRLDSLVKLLADDLDGDNSDIQRLVLQDLWPRRYLFSMNTRHRLVPILTRLATRQTDSDVAKVLPGCLEHLLDGIDWTRHRPSYEPDRESLFKTLLSIASNPSSQNAGESLSALLRHTNFTAAARWSPPMGYGIDTLNLVRSTTTLLPRLFSYSESGQAPSAATAIARLMDEFSLPDQPDIRVQGSGSLVNLGGAAAVVNADIVTQSEGVKALIDSTRRPLGLLSLAPYWAADPNKAVRLTADKVLRTSLSDVTWAIRQSCNALVLANGLRDPDLGRALRDALRPPLVTSGLTIRTPESDETLLTREISDCERRGLLPNISDEWVRLQVTLDLALSSLIHSAQDADRAAFDSAFQQTLAKIASDTTTRKDGEFAYPAYRSCVLGTRFLLLRDMQTIDPTILNRVPALWAAPEAVQSRATRAVLLSTLVRLGAGFDREHEMAKFRDIAGTLAGLLTECDRHEPNANICGERAEANGVVLDALAELLDTDSGRQFVDWPDISSSAYIPLPNSPQVQAILESFADHVFNTPDANALSLLEALSRSFDPWDNWRMDAYEQFLFVRAWASLEDIHKRSLQPDEEAKLGSALGRIAALWRVDGRYLPTAGRGLQFATSTGIKTIDKFRWELLEQAFGRSQIVWSDDEAWTQMVSEDLAFFDSLELRDSLEAHRRLERLAWLGPFPWDAADASDAKVVDETSERIRRLGRLLDAPADGRLLRSAFEEATGRRDDWRARYVAKELSNLRAREDLLAKLGASNGRGSMAVCSTVAEQTDTSPWYLDRFLVAAAPTLGELPQECSHIDLGKRPPVFGNDGRWACIVAMLEAANPCTASLAWVLAVREPEFPHDQLARVLAAARRLNLTRAVDDPVRRRAQEVLTGIGRRFAMNKTEEQELELLIRSISGPDASAY